MLLLFSRRGRLPLGKIGEWLQVHAASVTNAIDRLEAERLVVRLQNPDDGRGTLDEITPEGRRLARRATRMLNDRLFSDTGLDPAAIEVTVDNLRSIRAAAGDFDV
jgi:DNA-binding MarR family transcriptional regulator